MSEHFNHKIIKIEKIIPYINNARTHSDEQVAQLAGSIREFGFTNPVLVDGSSNMIAGHGRVLAARKLGMDSVPAVVVTGLDDARRKALILADNKLALNAGWDDELLAAELKALGGDAELTGFSEDELLDLLGGGVNDGLTDGDVVPDVPEDPVSNRGDVWMLGKHRVMCGDSTDNNDVDCLLNGMTIDMIFTDPPYGVSYADKNAFLNGLDKGNKIQVEIKADHMSQEETGKLWADVFSLWSKRQSDYSSYYIASPQGGDLFLMMMMMNENGMPLKHTIIWSKNNHVLGRSDYNYKHEPILYGWSNHHKFYGKGDHVFSVWNIAKPLKNDLHPTMKPVELVENCIRNSSKENHLIGDMFLGSGTSIIAAEKNNRKCYGMEIDEKYCDVTVNRWQDFTGKEATLESTGETFNALSEKNNTPSH